MQKPVVLLLTLVVAVILTAGIATKVLISRPTAVADPASEMPTSSASDSTNVPQSPDVSAILSGYPDALLWEMLNDLHVLPQEFKDAALTTVFTQAKADIQKVDLAGMALPSGLSEEEMVQRARLQLMREQYEDVLTVDSGTRTSTEIAWIRAVANFALNRRDGKPETMEQAIATFQNLLPAVDPSQQSLRWALATTAVADLLIQLGRPAEADPLLRKLEVHLASRLGRSDMSESVQRRLARCCQMTGKSEEAESLWRKVLAQDERRLGIDHPIVAQDANNLGLLLRTMDQMVEAERLLIRSATIYDRSPQRHASGLSAALTNLGRLMHDTGRMEMAKPLLRRAIDIEGTIHGQESPQVATAINNLAQMLLDMERFQEAEKLLRQAMAIDEKCFGHESSQYARRIGDLGYLLKKQKRLQDAEPLYREALAINERIFGADHPGLAIDLNNFSRLLHELQKFDEAEPLMRRYLVLLHKAGAAAGSTHPKFDETLANYRSLLQAMTLDSNDLEQRLKPFLSLEAMAEFHMSEAIAAYQSGQFGVVVKRTEDALAISEQLPSPPLEQILELKCLLGSALWQADEPQRARELLTDLIPEVDRQITTPSVFHGRTRYDLVSSIMLLQELNLKPAEELILESIKRYDQIADQTDYIKAMRKESVDLHQLLLEMKMEIEDRIKSTPSEITNSIGMKLKLIPAGAFLMGSRAYEVDSSEDEGPQHRVRISKPFYVGVTEVTQGEWFSVMNSKPWKGKDQVQEGDKYPAIYVNWDDAVEYCKRLSLKEGVTYRLPTEAEWEYACRGKRSTAYSFGADVSLLKNYAWSHENTSDIGEEYAHQVGTKKANPFGLYDMHGNLMEWCQDVYDEQAYAARSGTTVDPLSTSGSEARVLRGGSWFNVSRGARSADRSFVAPDYRFNYVGFRVVR